MKTKREYTAIYKKVGKQYAAWIEEIPGVNTQGRTLKEAKQNLAEAIQLILEENRKISALNNYDVQREKIQITTLA